MLNGILSLRFFTSIWFLAKYRFPIFFQCSGVIPPPGCDDRYPMSDVVSDYLFTCPSRYVFSQSPIATNIWAYSFNQPWSFKASLHLSVIDRQCKYLARLCSRCLGKDSQNEASQIN